MNKQTALDNIKFLANEKSRLVKQVKNLCKEILREATVDMELLVVKGRKYRIITTESNIGEERHVVIRDSRSERSLNFAKVEGGAFYLHQDFNCLIRRADWEDCVNFVDDFKSSFASSVKETLEKIQKRVDFFEISSVSSIDSFNR